MTSRLAYVATLSLVLAFASVARAHLGSTKYLHVDATIGGARVVIDVDPIDVGYELDLDDPEAGGAAILAAHRDAIPPWVARVITLRSDGGPCVASAGEPELVPIEGATRMREAIRVAIEFECPSPVTGLVLHDASVFEGDPQHEAVVRVGERATILRVGRQELAISDAPAAGETITTFLVEGAVHLVTGYDHVLFLLSLLLTAGLVAAKEGTRRAMRDVALVVTGFTLGHSVTLIAAALEVVSLPSRPVESAIAASILIVAVANLVRPDARAAFPWIATVFGLIHGFGFSSVLRELVLPTGERVAALIAFNVGIELAQLGIVAVVLPILAWAAHRAWYRRVVVQGGSIAIAAIAVIWLVERVASG